MTFYTLIMLKLSCFKPIRKEKLGDNSPLACYGTDITYPIFSSCFLKAFIDSSRKKSVILGTIINSGIIYAKHINIKIIIFIMKKHISN